MKIPDRVSALSSAPTDALSHHDASVSQSDASLFTSELEQPDNTPGITSSQVAKPEAMFDKTSTMFKHMDEDKKHLDNVLRKASHSTDPLVLNKVDGTLSNYYLQSLLNAKIVSKSVQGLEKLTNLQ